MSYTGRVPHHYNKKGSRKTLWRSCIDGLDREFNIATTPTTSVCWSVEARLNEGEQENVTASKGSSKGSQNDPLQRLRSQPEGHMAGSRADHDDKHWETVVEIL